MYIGHILIMLTFDNIVNISLKTLQLCIKTEQK